MDVVADEVARTGTATDFGALYEGAFPARRTGDLYRAFPYPTKISPEAVALYIAAHTNPGDTVFDGFAGSGTTGIAALLCEDPSEELRSEAKRLGLNIQWGARNAVLYEIGALGAFVGRTLTNPPEPHSFHRAALELLDEAVAEDGWVYRATDSDGCQGVIRHTVWSDILRCPSCRDVVNLWDACVSLKPARIASRFTCPTCNSGLPLDKVERVTELVDDDVLGEVRLVRARRPVRIYGASGKKTWSREVAQDDVSLLNRIETEAEFDSVPQVAIPWGDLHRSGYHQGVTHLHHFYTRRNLFVFSRLWARVGCHPGPLGDAMRFWLLSYNASHSTLMTRVVAKSNQNDLVVTSAQPGVLYVSGLPVEKNLFAGLRRKLTTISKAFSAIHGRKGEICVRQRSSCRVNLPDRSVDYVFTDPPFGGNIPYAEISFLNEGWLGRYTDRDEEIIVSGAQGKTVVEYENLLKQALREVCRILKRGGNVTLIFHSASANVWNALQSAYTDAGFTVESAGVLDKVQGSFKQVTTSGAVRGDPVLLLGRSVGSEADQGPGVWTVAERLRREAALTGDPLELTAQRIYSRLVSHFLIRSQQVPVDADSFYEWYRGRQGVEGWHR